MLRSRSLRVEQLEDRLTPALAAADVFPLFDVVTYLKSNPDVAAARVEPLTHFLQSGQFENRASLPYFDSQAYLTANPDVAAAGVSAVEHFVRFGQREQRNPGPLFDSDYYTATNPDVAATSASITPYAHFVLFGQREGRNPSPDFDTAAYRAANPDVVADGVFAAKHFALFGQYEGRDPGPAFSTAYYLRENPDVAAAVAGRGSPFAHWIQYGQYEGREAGPLSADTDLSTAIDLGTLGTTPVSRAVTAGQVFKFTLAGESVVAGRLGGVSGPAALQLLRSGSDAAADADDIIEKANATPTAPAVLTDVRAAGTYFVRAVASGAATGTLTLVARTSPATASVAPLIGTARPGPPLVTSGTLTAAGQPEVYSFTVPARSSVTVTTSGTTSGVLTTVYSATAGGLATAGKGTGTLTGVLKAGTYYISLTAGAATPFTLSVTAAAAPPQSPPPAVPPISNPNPSRNTPFNPPLGTLDARFGYGMARADRALALALGLTAVPDAPALTAADGTNFDDLNLMGVSAAWNRNITGAGVIVAVIDSGVNTTHYELAGRRPENLSRSFLTGGDAGVAGASDENGHGSHVAGSVAAARNGTGITGVAYGATVMSLKVFDRTGSGPSAATTAAINYAVANGAKVINLSLGGNSNDPDQQAAIRNAYEKGVVVIAASGNESKPIPGYPARNANVDPVALVAVGAVSRDRQVAGFSNGAVADPVIRSLVVAPGVGVVSLAPTGDGFLTEQGTSMATPHVAGLAALLLQANPTLTPAQVIDILNRSADPTGLTAAPFGS